MVRTSSDNNGGDSDISFNIEMRRQSNPLLPHGAEIGTLCELILDHRLQQHWRRSVGGQLATNPLLCRTLLLPYVSAPPPCLRGANTGFRITRG